MCILDHRDYAQALDRPVDRVFRSSAKRALP